MHLWDGKYVQVPDCLLLNAATACFLLAEGGKRPQQSPLDYRCLLLFSHTGRKRSEVAEPNPVQMWTLYLRIYNCISPLLVYQNRNKNSVIKLFFQYFELLLCRARHFMQLHILQRKSPFCLQISLFAFFAKLLKFSRNLKNGLVSGVNLP